MHNTYRTQVTLKNHNYYLFSVYIPALMYINATLKKNVMLLSLQCQYYWRYSHLNAHSTKQHTPKDTVKPQRT